MKYVAVQPEVISDVVYGVEDVRSVEPDIGPLAAKHWSEVEGGSKQSLAVMFDRYAQYAAAGKLAVVTARSADVLLGYLVLFFDRNPKAGDALVSYEDAFYVDPEARKLGVGQQLLTFAEHVAKTLGAKSLTMVSRHHTGGPDLTLWYRRCGYKPHAVTFVKEF